MCGIAGIINLNQEKKHGESLVLMTKTLKHRGPDDEGYLLYSDKPSIFYGDDSIKKNATHINTSFHTNFKVGFGFRQLKIIDLSTKSHQPMADVSKKFWIIFNGELYNYKEIKKQLIGLGHRFFSDSDTEVVLNSYKEWGEKALQKFNGMFAFAIFNAIKNEVFIARDRMGIKPLFFYKTNHHFIFGSTVKSIINSKLYSPEINWEGLQQNFRFNTSQKPNTVYKNITALEPAHFLTINLNTNNVEKKQYWEIPIHTQNLSLTEKQSINMVEESLYNAINYRLIADVEVGSFMSGGIDSSLISVLASKNNPAIKTLTLGFKEHKYLNEVNQAKETAKLHNLKHCIYYANASDSFNNLNQSINAYEEPYFHLFANFILAKMASENKTKVVLSGLGGDEIFGGYDVYKKISLWKTLRKNKKIVQFLPEFNNKISKGKQLANCNTLSEYYAHYYTNYNDTEIGNLFLSEFFSTKKTLDNLYLKEHKFTDTFEAISFLNLKSYIGNHQLRAVDASTMAFSIEGRLPFLDHNFIETAFKIPTKYKLKNNTQKYVLKKVAEKHLSKNVLNMPKKGLTLPLKNWIDTDLKDLVFDTINQLKNRNIFNNITVEKITKSKNEKQIWQLVTTELWLQNFIDK